MTYDSTTDDTPGLTFTNSDSNHSVVATVDPTDNSTTGDDTSNSKPTSAGAIIVAALFLFRRRRQREAAKAAMADSNPHPNDRL
ncbi:uncharacterized protein BCR38DRAFT_483703 [Pseudomassariella vexata]|uniref:Uncharacterized protein n=1 Tax=Pseudomassariella vexata TaxID=1141098 RepID=A0A1Y2E5A8_9PEZI|nr:uncharacterized protein BCR38DRAFT_483703 [Pseudomassariella vexata]ORY66045.1 hypothetical protein BCR38DRAFT_483703 [Pseudomassariella vexata]